MSNLFNKSQSFLIYIKILVFKFPDNTGTAKICPSSNKGLQSFKENL